MISFQLFKDVNVFLLKFDVLDHIGENVFPFGALKFSDASPFHHLKYIIKKKYIHMTSVWRDSTLGKPVRDTNVLVEK